MSFWFGGYPRLSVRVQLTSALFAGFSIFAVGELSSRFIEGGGFMVLMASMGASAVILYCVPDSPMAKPWPLIAGHLFSGLVGIGSSLWLPSAWQASVAVGLSILIMHITRSLHPPGGATALTVVLGGEQIHQMGFGFLLAPLAINVGIMFLINAVFVMLRDLSGVRHQKPSKPAQSGSPIVQLEDLHAILQEVDEYVDIDEDELERIYRLAAERASQRAALQRDGTKFCLPEMNSD